MSCGCKELRSIAPKVSVTVRNDVRAGDAKEAARAEFEHQARAFVEDVRDYPERLRRSAIEAQIARFEEPRYRLVNSVAVEILRAAL